jgi:hypothetical protein
MRVIKNTILSVLLAGSAVTVPFAAQAANVFDFQFYEGSPSPSSLVGGGTFATSTDLGPGTYDLTSLSDFSMAFGFITGNSYTQANIATPLTGVAVRITDLGGGLEQLFFTEGRGPGADGGPLSGSLDLINGANSLSFEPTFFGGNVLFEEGPTGRTGFFGQYNAFSVPEPASAALLGLGFLGFVASRRKSAKGKAV